MFGLSFVSSQTGGVLPHQGSNDIWELFFDRGKIWNLFPSTHSSYRHDFCLRRWRTYCRQFAQLVKDQEKFITQPLFSLLPLLLTHSGETKLRQQASGETITGPLLFLHWGHPSARRSRNKGQGFIAGSTVWKEMHSNIVWFSEIVAGIPAVSYCIIAI